MNNDNWTKEQLYRLRYLISHNRLPDNINWEAVYGFWLKGTGIIKPSPRPIKIKTERELLVQRARTINSRAKKLGVVGIVDVDILTRVFEKYNKRCDKCGTVQNLVFDHTIPMYRGGSNTEDNLQILCRICNMEKGVSLQV
jgi:hypothetical protein